MNNKSKLKGINFLDISNTSDNVDKEALANLPQNTCKRNPRIYINYNLCPYYRFLYCKVKEMMQESLIHNSWVSKGDIIKIRESASLTPFSVTGK